MNAPAVTIPVVQCMGNCGIGLGPVLNLVLYWPMHMPSLQQVTKAVATGPRVPSFNLGGRDGDEPLKIQIGEGMMGELGRSESSSLQQAVGLGPVAVHTLQTLSAVFLHDCGLLTLRTIASCHRRGLHLPRPRDPAHCPCASGPPQGQDSVRGIGVAVPVLAGSSGEPHQRCPEGGGLEC